MRTGRIGGAGEEVVQIVLVGLVSRVHSPTRRVVVGSAGLSVRVNQEFMFMAWAQGRDKMKCEFVGSRCT